jgi:hypothetical protein
MKFIKQLLCKHRYRVVSQERYEVLSTNKGVVVERVTLLVMVCDCCENIEITPVNRDKV